jgi:hypothetical protein
MHWNFLLDVRRRAHSVTPIAEHPRKALGYGEQQQQCEQVDAYLAWVAKNRPRPLDA